MLLAQILLILIASSIGILGFYFNTGKWQTRRNRIIRRSAVGLIIVSALGTCAVAFWEYGSSMSREQKLDEALAESISQARRAAERFERLSVDVEINIQSHHSLVETYTKRMDNYLQENLTNEDVPPGNRATIELATVKPNLDDLDDPHFSYLDARYIPHEGESLIHNFAFGLNVALTVYLKNNSIWKNQPDLALAYLFLPVESRDLYLSGGRIHTAELVTLSYGFANDEASSKLEELSIRTSPRQLTINSYGVTPETLVFKRSPQLASVRDLEGATAYLHIMEHRPFVLPAAEEIADDHWRDFLQNYTFDVVQLRFDDELIFIGEDEFEYKNHEKGFRYVKFVFPDDL